MYIILATRRAAYRTSEEQISDVFNYRFSTQNLSTLKALLTINCLKLPILSRALVNWSNSSRLHTRTQSGMKTELSVPKYLHGVISTWVTCLVSTTDFISEFVGVATKCSERYVYDGVCRL